MEKNSTKKISPEAIIFDFGFTLFHFRNPSLERWNKLEEEGLNLVVEFLKKGGLFEKETQLIQFTKKVKSLNFKFLKMCFKTKLEYTSSYIFEQALKDIKYLDPVKLEKFSTSSMLEKMSDLYYSAGESEWIPFEDTRRTLESLSEMKIKTAVLSNIKHHNIVLRQLKEHNLLDFFETVVTSAQFGKRKPNVEIFWHILEKLGLSHCPKECIMVGDEVADMIGGKKAELKTILIVREFKFPFEQELKSKYHPDFKVNKVSEIIKLISK